jgi:CheY-like chemotaxis protein
MLPWVSQGEAGAAVSQKIVSYRGYQRTVMVVDDDPVVRGLLADILVPIGFTVLEAADAEACLNELEGLSPDLFILDVTMPGMDGLTLAKTLREKGFSAPILMLSADAQESRRKPEEQGAFNQYLVKPIRNRDLLDTIQLWLSVEWVYQESESNHLPAGDDVVPVLTDDRSLLAEATDQLDLPAIPDHESVRELLAFAEMGYKKGVRRVLDQLTETRLIHDRHLQQLEDHYLRFQFDAIADYLTENRGI